MPIPDYPLDEKRIRVLVALYNHTRNEIDRYRDYEWRISSYVLGLFGASIALSLNSQFRSLWTEFTKALLTIFVCAIGLFGSIYVGYFHKKCLEHRKRRDSLDELLGFFKPGMFIEGEKTLLPLGIGASGATWIYAIVLIVLIIIACALNVTVFLKL